MAARVMYDRVIITVNGQVYNPDGEIRRFRASARARILAILGSPIGILYGYIVAILVTSVNNRDRS